jgi:metal transporter CNNM
MVTTISARSQALQKSSYGVSALSSARLLLVGLIHAAVTCARPFTNSVDIYKEHHHSDVPDEPRSPEDAQLWIYLSVALLLVLLGGAFAGLTIAYAHAWK